MDPLDCDQIEAAPLSEEEEDEVVRMESSSSEEDNVVRAGRLGRNLQRMKKFFTWRSTAAGPPIHTPAFPTAARYPRQGTVHRKPGVERGKPRYKGDTPTLKTKHKPPPPRLNIFQNPEYVTDLKPEMLRLQCETLKEEDFECMSCKQLLNRQRELDAVHCQLEAIKGKLPPDHSKADSEDPAKLQEYIEYKMAQMKGRLDSCLTKEIAKRLRKFAHDAYKSEHAKTKKSIVKRITELYAQIEKLQAFQDQWPPFVFQYLDNYAQPREFPGVMKESMRNKIHRLQQKPAFLKEDKVATPAAAAARQPTPPSREWSPSSRAGTPARRPRAILTDTPCSASAAAASWLNYKTPPRTRRLVARPTPTSAYKTPPGRMRGSTPTGVPAPWAPAVRPPSLCRPPHPGDKPSQRIQAVGRRRALFNDAEVQDVVNMFQRYMPAAYQGESACSAAEIECRITELQNDLDAVALYQSQQPPEMMKQIRFYVAKGGNPTEIMEAMREKIRELKDSLKKLKDAKYLHDVAGFEDDACNVETPKSMAAMLARTAVLNQRMYDLGQIRARHSPTASARIATPERRPGQMGEAIRRKINAYSRQIAAAAPATECKKTGKIYM